MLLELIVVGTLWFWLLILAECGFVVYCAANGKGLSVSVSILLVLVALQLFSNVDVIGHIRDNPVWIILGIVLYAIGGVAWVFPKWWMFVNDHRRKYTELRDEFLEANKLQPGDKIPEELKDTWHNKLNYRHVSVEFKPNHRHHENRILTWMILWPISLAWTMLNDPVVRFFRYVYGEIAGVLQRISDNAFKDVEDDFKKDKK